jgi:ATP-dependent Clp protease protease subunit
MQYVKCPVATICTGQAASMGAFLLSAGAKGKRFALPNSEIMIHEPSGGYQGKSKDMEIYTERIVQMRKTLNQIIAANTGQPLEKVEADVKKDYFMTAEEAKAYGLIDEVLIHR